MILQALRIYETAVVRHIKDYEQSKKLIPENGGSSEYLSATLTMTLLK